jgi:sialidase-1
VLPDGDQHRDYGLMAGLVRLPVEGRNILIFSNIESSEGRRGGTVWASLDGGKTWSVKRMIDEGPFAYSSLAAGRPNTPSEGWIYLQYEGRGGGRIARFNLAWLLEGRPTGEGEIPEIK